MLMLYAQHNLRLLAEKKFEFFSVRNEFVQEDSLLPTANLQMMNFREN